MRVPRMSWCLRLVRLAAAGLLILPAALSAQGAMANGLNYAAAISLPGEVDNYTFTATAGDNLIVAIGETGGNSAFVPWIRLQRPEGAVIGESWNVLAAQVEAVAPSTGTYTVLVASADAGLNDTGTYTLTLAKSPGAFSVSGGDEGGPMTNGSNHTGFIHVGDVDMWSFDAAAGDNIILGVGEVGVDSAFQPWIRLKSPTGANLGNSWNVLAAQIEATASVTGTYTVIVSTADAGLDATGNYTLTLSKSPGAFTISDGDEGGLMTNGSNHTGDIHVGDVDMWSFNATAGESITVAIGEVGMDSAFQPWIRLKSPTGANLGNSWNVLAAQIEATASVTGTYTVVVASADAGLDGVGAYTLTLAKAPGAYTITPGDQGGPMTNGANHTGDIHVGDLDMWSFDAAAGDSIVLAVGEVGNTALTPWIRLRGPGGQNLGESWNVLAAQIEATAPAAGTYTVIISTADAGLHATGSYTLTLAKTPGAFTPGDEGGGMTNGGNYTGDIHVGDVDMWSFQAVAGEALTVSIGETGIDTAFTPWLRLKGPTGANMGETWNVRAAQINVNATVTGTYTVIVSTADAGLDATGSYTLTIANTPRPFIVPLGDEGGALATGNNTGTIHIGDVDMWTFSAHEGDPLNVIVTEVSGTDFTPWIRLRTPTGTLLGSQSGAAGATILVNAPATGVYTILVATADGGLDGFGDYTLAASGITTSMICNGGFSAGETCWQFFATPTLAYIVHQVTNGVLQYYRVPPPPGTANQAVAYQETGVTLPATAPIAAQFDLANTSTARKRISVLILDADFSDLHVCTFWLEAGAPMRTYRMRTHTTEAWTNAAIYFYAASAGQNGGFYEIDNVAMAYVPEQADDRTDCVDPTAPAPPGGASGPNLLQNGDFNTGTLAPWFTFGTITTQITGGVLEFLKASSTAPAGVVAQLTGQTTAAGDILTATFQLGNSSAVRKRVTVILHDQDFSDLAACTFLLAPGQPLSDYVVRSWATEAWANAMLSIYPATVGGQQWILADNVTFQRTPSAATAGTDCLEPGAESLSLAEEGRQAPAADASASTSLAAFGAAGVGGDAWLVVDPPRAETAAERDGALTIDLRGAESARLDFVSRLDGVGSRGVVQVSLDGATWFALDRVPESDRWTPVDLDLTQFAGEVIRLRFVLEPEARFDLERSAVWRLSSIRVVIR